MPEFALNHMSVARVSYVELLKIAAALGFVGVEIRNDLNQPLFDGLSPAEAGELAQDRGLRLLSVAEVKRFNDWTPERQDEAAALMDIAAAAGAEAVSLIPRNDNAGMGNGERQANLRIALRDLKPMLDDRGLSGLVEPLGFASCALRQKAEAVDAITDLETGGTFQLVHDTFHHFLAGGGPIFAESTGIVHISGVLDPALSISEMRDAHRVLVDGRDRLGNIDQIDALASAGYRGPISYEAFAKEVHNDSDPVGSLKRSMEFIRTRLTAAAA